jgi:hypothetical protein
MAVATPLTAYAHAVAGRTAIKTIHNAYGAIRYFFTSL